MHCIILTAKTVVLWVAVEQQVENLKLNTESNCQQAKVENLKLNTESNCQQAKVENLKLNTESNCQQAKVENLKLNIESNCQQEKCEGVGKVSTNLFKQTNIRYMCKPILS